MRLHFFNSAVIANSKMDYWHTITYDKQQEKAPWGRGCYYTLYTVVMYSPNAYQFRGVCHSYENKRLLSIKRLLLGLLGRLLNH